MPPGVLSKIFYHLCSDGPLELRHLLFASKGLYYAAVNDASLWMIISFDAKFFEHFRKRPVKQAESFTEQCLRWSSSLPLCIRIYFDDAFAGDILPGPLRALWNPKYKGSERCTSFTWYNNGRDRVPDQKVIALLPKELPSLRHLSLTHFTHPTEGTQFPNCPVLERVELLGYYEPYPSCWGTNFARVTTLSFGDYGVWTTCDTGTLSLFPALRYLTLFNMHSGAAQMLDNPKHAPPFQHLQTLRVRGNLPSKLLTWLVAPALEALHIEANDFDHTPIVRLCYSFSPLCFHLYALLPESIARTEPRWATYLLKFVLRCTRIQTLFVSKWMELQCMAFLGCSNVVLHVL